MTNSTNICSSSNLHTYCLLMKKSNFNILSHIKFATQFTFVPVITSFLCDLTILVHLDCQMPSASLWNKHTIRCDVTFSILLVSKSKLIFSKYVFSFLTILFSKYSRYYLCSTCDETGCAMFADFCSSWLLLKAIFVTLGQCLLRICHWSFLSLFWDRFLHFTLQNTMAFIDRIYFEFLFVFWFSGRLDRSQRSVF
jgi:hypothetical protein